MKVLTSIMVMFILSGCSTDDLQQDTITDSTNSFNKLAKKNRSQKNPHAHVGAVYQNLLDSYYRLPNVATDLEDFIEQIETIATLDPGFANLNYNSSYKPLSSAEIAPYLAGGTLEDLLSQDYSLQARAILSDIAGELESMKALDLPYQNVEAFFKVADASIAGNPTLTIEEKDALLITTTIVCNALDNDRKRKRRDRDWEWMTTHLAATANAAIESTPQSIMMSLATDAYQH